MSSSFNHSLKVVRADIDELGHVNNVVYVRYVQEVAAAHWSIVADEALREKYLWVVLRHEIDYKHPAFLNEVIRATTWVGEQ
jgi:acyl-CoA thioester hydrolase